MTTDQIKQRLAKLLALAERGVGGEAHNAREILQRTLAEHELTIADICDEAKTLRRFSHPGGLQLRLLCQILVTVCGKDRPFFVPRHKKKTGISVEMTNAEYVEASMLLSVHKKKLKDEVDLFFSAYVHKFHLFPPDAGKETVSDPAAIERLERMAQMMMGISNVSIHKQLERKTPCE